MSSTANTPILHLPYPVPADQLREFPDVSKEQMMLLDTHTHEDHAVKIDELKDRLILIEKSIEALKTKKYVRGKVMENVAQVKDVGFTIPNINPKRTVVTVQAAGVDEKNRLFCYYNSASKKHVIVRVMVNAEQGKPASKVPGGKFNIIYFTES